MAEASGDPRILPAMQSFTDQQGVPLVTFDPDGKGGYRVTQSRYTRLGSTAPAIQWGIPLCARRLTGKKQCQLLDQQSGSIRLPGRGAIVPNVGGTGYYRFELPAGEWDALIAKADKLPGGEALAFDDSLFASFQAGRASAPQLVTGAVKLASNPDSYASEAGIGSLAWFYRAGMLDEAGEEGYRALIRQIYAPKVKAMGFTPRAGAYASEDPEKSQLRIQAVATLAGTGRDPELRKALGTAARAYLAGDKAALDAAWYGSAFAVLVDEGGMAAVKQLIDAGLGSQDSLLRGAALGAAATSGKEDIARWLLDEFDDPRLRRNERQGFIRGVIGARDTRDWGFAWLQTNFEKVIASGGGIFFTARLPSMVGGYCSVQKADEIAAFLRPKLAGKTGALDLERTVERVRSCGVLKEARGAELSAEFKKIK